MNKTIAEQLVGLGIVTAEHAEEAAKKSVLHKDELPIINTGSLTKKGKRKKSGRNSTSKTSLIRGGTGKGAGTGTSKHRKSGDAGPNKLARVLLANSLNKQEQAQQKIKQRQRQPMIGSILELMKSAKKKKKH